VCSNNSKFIQTKSQFITWARRNHVFIKLPIPVELLSPVPNISHELPPAWRNVKNQTNLLWTFSRTTDVVNLEFQILMTDPRQPKSQPLLKYIRFRAEENSLGLNERGTIWSFGSNSYGQSGTQVMMMRFSIIFLFTSSSDNHGSTVGFHLGDNEVINASVFT
jgi:hypothetical protein